MEINLSPKAKLQLEEIDKEGNGAKRRKFEKLMLSILASPYHGKGKPEPLKHRLQGFWSRRITKEDRIIYDVEDSIVTIYSLKGHY